MYILHHHVHLLALKIHCRVIFYSFLLFDHSGVKTDYVIKNEMTLKCMLHPAHILTSLTKTQRKRHMHCTVLP